MPDILCARSLWKEVWERRNEDNLKRGGNIEDTNTCAHVYSIEIMIMVTGRNKKVKL